MSGEEVSLADLRGKAVLLNFRTTSCQYCRQETPSLQEAHETIEGLVVLSVYVLETAERVAAYSSDLSITFAGLIDESGDAMRAYGVRGVPTSFFVDADGVVTASHIGPLTVSAIRGYLEASR